MREQIQKYYADKKIFWRIVIVIAFVLVIFFQLNGDKRGMDISFSNKLSFAGEVMPKNWRYALNRERFDREVALLEINEAQFIIIYKRWNLIVPMIEKSLKKAGLPDDLKYIPVIESALRDNVSSSAGAAGLWQFMPDTAKRYGLVVNEFVDERFDVAKSTAAAMLYFKDLGKQFDKRTLVAAAYNRGENGLQKSLESQYTNNFYDLRLNNETSRYVFRLLSMKYVWENKYSFFESETLGDMYSPFATKYMSVKKIDDIADRARKNNLWYFEVKKLNPWIMTNSLPDGKWDINIITND
ncbi:MAG: lytic transglycosylase catalytic [uncultured bacterium (gcode 4)]|uniref:Lytic transglycosylase catalytic n=1 Tax=uncultured bacterium (gcode 4) TaxID=1234023 RepID=K1XJS0_9BACT|nr:MAG: lytic transglycosylase catalytic [uncultured bacterium (gcode 4)]